MNRRTNAKDDPNRNAQLSDGMLQLEPAKKRFDYDVHAVNLGRHEEFIQIGVLERGYRGKSAYIMLDVEELGELIGELTLIRNTMLEERV